MLGSVILPPLLLSLLLQCAVRSEVEVNLPAVWPQAASQPPVKPGQRILLGGSTTQPKLTGRSSTWPMGQSAQHLPQNLGVIKTSFTPSSSKQPHPGITGLHLSSDTSFGARPAVAFSDDSLLLSPDHSHSSFGSIEPSAEAFYSLEANDSFSTDEIMLPAFINDQNLEEHSQTSFNHLDLNWRPQRDLNGATYDGGFKEVSLSVGNQGSAGKGWQGLGLPNKLLVMSTTFPSKQNQAVASDSYGSSLWKKEESNPNDDPNIFQKSRNRYEKSGSLFKNANSNGPDESGKENNSLFANQVMMADNGMSNTLPRNDASLQMDNSLMMPARKNTRPTYTLFKSPILDPGIARNLALHGRHLPSTKTPFKGSRLSGTFNPDKMNMGFGEVLKAGQSSPSSSSSSTTTSSSSLYIQLQSLLGQTELHQHPSHLAVSDGKANGQDRSEDVLMLPDQLPFDHSNSEKSVSTAAAFPISVLPPTRLENGAITSPRSGVSPGFGQDLVKFDSGVGNRDPMTFDGGFFGGRLSPSGSKGVLDDMKNSFSMTGGHHQLNEPGFGDTDSSYHVKSVTFFPDPFALGRNPSGSHVSTNKFSHFAGDNSFGFDIDSKENEPTSTFVSTYSHHQSFDPVALPSFFPTFGSQKEEEEEIITGSTINDGQWRLDELSKKNDEDHPSFIFSGVGMDNVVVEPYQTSSASQESDYLPRPAEEATFDEPNADNFADANLDGFQRSLVRVKVMPIIWNLAELRQLASFVQSGSGVADARSTDVVMKRSTLPFGDKERVESGQTVLGGDGSSLKQQLKGLSTSQIVEKVKLREGTRSTMSGRSLGMV